MYTPRAFAETDLTALDWLFARDRFVTLVSVADGLPQASHLPVLYARDGERVLIEGHWAKANPQSAQAGPVLMIVHGPHAYVSPGWYPDKEPAARVPTWNYTVAHLSGKLERSQAPDFLASVVARLSHQHEQAIGSDWRYEPEREDHRGQLRGIVGFRFVPERIKLKFKLSQNHPAANIAGVIRGLGGQDEPQARAIAGLMQNRQQATPGSD